MKTSLNCARRIHKLKLSTLHEINSLKVSQACNLFDNVHVDDVVVALQVAVITGSL